MGNALHRLDQVLTADPSFQADETIQIRSRFVKDFEAFVIWIKQQAAESEESIKYFEEIFSVKAQIRLYSNIQDTRDELGMLKAVFDDQIQVLTTASEHLEHEKKSQYHSRSRALEEQSLQNLKLVEKLQTQTE